VRRRRLKNEETADGAQEEVEDRLLISLSKARRQKATFRVSDFQGGARIKKKYIPH
tara:strand:- start:141 stop:308 length:168 start_codon:yes stop_codon:yes gene_type:complete